MAHFNLTKMSDVQNMTRLERVTYASAGITAPSESGEYVLKGTTQTGNGSGQYQIMYVDFGKEIPAGSTLTFKMYVPSTYNKNCYISGIQTYVSGSGWQAHNFTPSNVASNTWAIFTVTLNSAQSWVRIRLNNLQFVQAGGAPTAIYFDDFRLNVAE